ncbi:unnamed protein product, partial [Effrenium voratum]
MEDVIQQRFRDLEHELQKVQERLSVLEDRGIILEETEDNGHAEAVAEASDEPKKKPQKSEKSLKSLQSEKSEKSEKEPKVDGQGVLEVYVDESVWSVFFVVGLERSVFNGFLDSFIAGLLTLVNLVVQILFLGVILSEDFLGEPFESKKSAARLWRSFVAHDARHLDLAGTSLASRVCGQDGALIVANAQASLVEEINSYLNLQPDQFNTDGFRPGAVLCMLCILIWSVFVIRELRTYLHSFLGLLTLRRGGLSVLTQGSEIVSYQRLGLLILVHLCRVVMAIWLLYAGILWLASTTSIADLILNCVALEVIFEVDALLFAALMPMETRFSLRKLKPMRISYTRARSQLEALLGVVVLVATLFVAYTHLVAPLEQTMLEVKHELCGGNAAFVVSYSEDTQVARGVVTTPSRDLDLRTVSQTVVDDYKFSDSSQYIWFSATLKQFQAESARSVVEEVQSTPICWETDVFQPTGKAAGDVLLVSVADVRLNAAELALGQVDSSNQSLSMRERLLSRCHAMRSFCDDYEGRLLRMLCGATCCQDARASFWYKVEALGCSQLCPVQVSASECVDVSKDHPNWHKAWDEYVP